MLLAVQTAEQQLLRDRLKLAFPGDENAEPQRISNTLCWEDSPPTRSAEERPKVAPMRSCWPGQQDSSLLSAANQETLRLGQRLIVDLGV